MKKVGYILLVISLIMIVLGIVLEMIDFYNDYKCSTTTDIEWFIENNCMRYME